MLRKTFFVPLMAASAMMLTTPAYAGKKDRAQEAIAAADAKIHTAEGLGTGAEVPRVTAEARAALALARESLKAGHKSTAIEQAIHASALADTAIGEMQRRKNQDVAAAQHEQHEAVAAAQDQAEAARQQAADANARAAAAEQSAASSAAQAAYARDAAAAAAQPAPTQVETTVTTEQPTTTTVHRAAPARVTRPTTRRVVRHTAPAKARVTTTTTVTH